MDERTMWEDLGKINPSIESEVIEAGNISDVEIRCPRPNVSDNYNKLSNKPTIEDIELKGNKTLNDLGIQKVLESGTNIKTINNESLLGEGNIEISGGSGGTTDYNDLSNKPKINDVTLSGNVSLDTLGITDLIDTKISTAIGNTLKGSY